MEHPEALVNQLEKEVSIGHREKFNIFLCPEQSTESAQIAKCLQPKLSMHVYPTLLKQKSTILYLKLRNSIPWSKKRA